MNCIPMWVVILIQMVILSFSISNLMPMIALLIFFTGPEVEPSEENQGNFLEELSEGLRSYLNAA